MADADGSTYWLNTILCNERSEPRTVELPIGGMNLCFKIDTGADISVISQATYMYHQLPQKPTLQPCKLSLMSPVGQVESAGEFIAHTKLGNDVYNFCAIVLTQEGNNLLSRDVATKMNLVTRIQEVHNGIFGEMGLMKTTEVKIHVDPNAVPYSVATGRCVPLLS